MELENSVETVEYEPPAIVSLGSVDELTLAAQDADSIATTTEG